MTDTQEEVKPCPFCGNTPLGSDGKPQFLAHQGTKWGSLVCCCLGPEVRTEYKDESHWGPDAIEEWNKRPIEEALRARVEELEGALQRLSDAVCTADVEDESPLIGGAFDEACKVLNNGEKNEDA